jgi:signal transduction histidine kinase
MQDQLLPQSRAERLIALGRAVLTAASIGAIYLDPLEPERYPVLTYALLLAYAVYAVGFVLWAILGPAGASPRFRIGSHVLDLAFFGTLNYLTAGASSPFFVFFVFSIVCAILRFGRRGTAITAVVAILIFVASVVARMDASAFELNRFIIRAAYLLVVASLLVYLADYQQRIQADLARIARWRRSTSYSFEVLIEELLREPAVVFDAKRVILVYEHLANRYGFLATRRDDEIECAPLPRLHTDLLLEGDTSTFVRSGSYAAISPDTPKVVEGLAPEIAKAYDIEDVLATSFRGQFVYGRLLLLDGPLPLLEEVNLARITASVIASRLDNFHAAEQLKRGAVAEERVRVARDLHDSVLQSLTGVALQLRTLPRLMVRDRDAAEQRLREIEQVITSGQKDLRWFIEQLNPERRREADETAAIADRLLSMSHRFESQWGLRVDADVAPIIHLLPVPMRHEVYTIVSEAVANAAKHASAKQIRVAATVDPAGVHIDVSDDGKGFSFRGRYSVGELTRMNAGPATLKERVIALGGSMTIDSSDGGSHIEIDLPLQHAANGV